MRRLAAVVLLATCAAACEEAAAPKTALNYTADSKRAYDAALAEFDAHNWLEAQALLREVKRKYSYSKYARLAELRIADADFEQEKFVEALRGYKAFIHDHKGDVEEVQYARARAAETQYREIGDSLLMPASEERDQAPVIDSYKEIASFLREYPEAREAPRVCLLLEDVTARLVRHEMVVARFYLNKGNYDAAVLRLQYAMRNYAGDPPCSTVDKPRDPEVAPVIKSAPRHEQNFGLAPDTLLLLGETYMKMQKWEDARRSFDALLSRYAASPLRVQAKGYLAELDRKKS
jgi:outer membrane protein assembly factor BamD